MKTAALLAVLASACACASAEHVHPSRIHLVDRSKSGNFLFRGNMPINATGFAYDEIKQVMAQRAHEAGVANFPEDVFVHVVSFNNPFEMNDIDHELQFCRWYPSLCKVDIWLLVGNIVPPSVVPKELRKDLAENFVWAVDKLPQRTREMKKMLDATYDRPRAFYVHCEAGCDRTGEFCGSYRLENMNFTMADAWQANIKECGRPPNNFSKGAFEWFCVYANENGGDVGSCSV